MKLERPEERFDEIYAIYTAAFPEDEKRTYEKQKERLQDEKCSVVVMEEEGQIVSFLEYWDLNSCIFIEYLASAKEWRNKGLGRRLLDVCLEDAREQGKPVFLEMEPVREDEPLTGRRASFYRRIGFCQNHFRYHQPPLKEGDDWKELEIMSYGIQVEEEKFRTYQKEIYKHVYQREG